VDIKINNIMQKDYVIIVTINMEELKNLGIVITKNCMQLECVKTATLITIIEKNVKQNLIIIYLNKNNSKSKL
jgi:hypothetical protein